MSRILQFIKQRYRIWLKALYFLVAIVATVLVLPPEGKFKYEFQKGKAWMHEDLVAPFDFPIYKTDAELISERNAILNNSKTFFKLDTTSVSKAVAKFHSDFNKEWNKSSEPKIVPDNQLIDLFEKELRFIHLKGIINPDEYPEIRDKLFTGLTVLHGKLALDTPFEELFTTHKAISQLKKTTEAYDITLGNNTQEILLKLPLSAYVKPNLIYDVHTTERMQKDMLANLSITEGLVYAGERIVTEGEILDAELYQILFSLKREFESQQRTIGNRNILLLGQILLVAIMYLSLFLFLLHFKKEVLQEDSKLLFILILVVTMSVISLLLLRKNLINVYVIPFAIIPIFIRTLYDSRLALFIYLINIFLVGFFVPNSFEFVFLHFIAGIVAIVSLAKIYGRGKLFLAVGYIFLSYSIVYTSIGLIQEGTIHGLNPLALAWFAGNALLLLASYQLIYLFEKIFGFLSDTTLMELSDTNEPLLRKLAEFAPGTFQHSIQVANLAESAIHIIGGNPLLVRTGALYHDIGKLQNPYYFIENQSSVFNPHDNLSYLESAEKIISHVTEGVQIAKRHRLPEQIIDFIKTHHGTTKTEYFYRLYKNKFPDAKEELHLFSYPGPKPYSKETAVLMMADSVEAASRALKTITVEAIENLVEAIINHQMNEGQFSEANITFKDISEIKLIFKKRLLNTYHARIEYPEEEQQAEPEVQ